MPSAPRHDQTVSWRRLRWVAPLTVAAVAAAPHPAALSAMAPDHVLILMLLHVAAFAVCVALLTTLARRRAAPALSAG